MSILYHIRRMADIFFSEKEWVRDYTLAPNWYIAAGNPTKSVGLIENKIEFDEDTQQKQLIVAGDSMSPRGIYAGDRISLEPISDPLNANITRGTFISIAVDSDYYRSKNKKSRFQYKLRCAICKIPSGISYEAMLNHVKKTDKTVFIEEYQRELGRKFREARKYYGEEESLMLSVTYKGGKMHYSFHPIRLIEGKVEKVERYNNVRKSWETIAARKLL